MTLGELTSSMRGRGAAMLAILLAAPFLQPIPLPGLGEVLGVGIAMACLRLSSQERPWLPEFVYRRSLSPRIFKIVITAALMVAGWIEKLTRPRLGFMFGGIKNHIHGFALSYAGALLAIPLLPVPGTHFIRALPIVIIAAGWMERDGLWVLIGYALLVAATVVGVIVAYEMFEEVLKLSHHYRH